MYILLALLLTGCLTADLRAHATTTPVATEQDVRVAQRWLAQLDAHQYAASWATTSAHFRSLMTQATWEQASRTYREPLGALLSRSALTTQYTQAVPGLPPGHYAGMSFQSSFAKQPTAIETVLLLKDADGHWKVAGYTIK